MSRTNPPGAALHLSVSLLECDSEATLKETLLLLEGLPIHAVRIGDCAVAFPAHQLSIVKGALESQQRYPTVVGSIQSPEAEEDR